MKILSQYFPGMTGEQSSKLEQFREWILFWNQRINLVSRKETAHLEVHHILFSLSIARYVSFLPGSRILDAGTGGGFPGIPLAILFPESEFTLADSIEKKIRAVTNICRELGLANVTPVTARVEQLNGSFDFVVARAVARLPEMIRLVKHKISPVYRHPVPNGILYLKGGEFGEELEGIPAEYHIYPLRESFREPFLETKKLVHLYNLR